MDQQKQTSTKYFTRGGQITFHNLRMLLQINGTVIHVWIALFLLLFVVISLFLTSYDMVVNGVYFLYAQLLATFKTNHTFSVPFHGQHIPETTRTILSQPYFQKNYAKLIIQLKHAAIIAFVISIIFSFFIVRWLVSRGKKQTDNQFIRGATLEDAKTVAGSICKKKQASDIWIDDLPLLVNSETQNFSLVGTVGTGKTQLIMKIADGIRKRRQKAIIYDKGCNLVKHYYREGIDHILNPFDDRCSYWDIWSEGLAPTVFENMANSLIPMHGEGDPFWVNAARTIFSTTAYKMRGDRNRSNTKLLQLLLTKPLEDISQYLQNTESATLVDGKIEKTAISIKSVLAAYLKSLRFLDGLSTTNGKNERNANNENNKNKKNNKSRKSFSITDWINRPDDSWLFITSNAHQHASLRPLVSMWFAIAANAVLSLEADLSRRIWFLMDELPSLHKLPDLPESIAEGRKFGACFVLGMQSNAQQNMVYGHNASNAISDLLNTRFYFRSPSYEMAKWIERELGEQEYEELRENYSYGANTIRDGISIGHQRVVRPIVAYPEIMRLPDLSCFVRLPGDFPIARLALKLEKRPNIANHFISRQISIDPEVELMITSCLNDTPESVRKIIKKTNQQHSNDENTKKESLVDCDEKEDTKRINAKETETETENKEMEEDELINI